MAKRQRRRGRKKSGGCFNQLVAFVLVAIILFFIGQASRDETKRTSTPRPTRVNTVESTAVPAATRTTRPTRTARPATSVVTSSPISITYYVNASQRVNVRECPALDCAVVTVASPGDALLISDDSGEWYQLTLDNGGVAYISASLVSKSKPVVQPQIAQPQPTSQPAVAATSVPQPAQATNIPDTPVSESFPRPRYCETAVAYGLGAAEIAERWPHLDRDKDGVACYDD